jgi:hypothetical protein
VSIGTTTIVPLSFRGGVLVLALIYLGLGLVYALIHPGPEIEPIDNHP